MSCLESAKTHFGLNIVKLNIVKLDEILNMIFFSGFFWKKSSLLRIS